MSIGVRIYLLTFFNLVCERNRTASGGAETVLMRGGHNPLAETHWTSLIAMLQLDST
jgi:hypothetical protein